MTFDFCVSSSKKYNSSARFLFFGRRLRSIRSSKRLNSSARSLSFDIKLRINGSSPLQARVSRVSRVAEFVSNTFGTKVIVYNLGESDIMRNVNMYRR